MVQRWIKNILRVIWKVVVICFIAVSMLIGLGVASKSLFDDQVEKATNEKTREKTEESISWKNLEKREQAVTELEEEKIQWQISNVIPEVEKAERLILDEIGNFGQEMVDSLFNDNGGRYYKMLNINFIKQMGYRVDERAITNYSKQFVEEMQHQYPDISLYSARFKDSNCVETVFHLAHLSTDMDEAGESTMVEAHYSSAAIYSMRYTIWFDENGSIISFIPCRLADFPDQAEILGFVKKDIYR